MRISMETNENAYVIPIQDAGLQTWLRAYRTSASPAKPEASMRVRRPSTAARPNPIIDVEITTNARTFDETIFLRRINRQDRRFCSAPRASHSGSTCTRAPLTAGPRLLQARSAAARHTAAGQGEAPEAPPESSARKRPFNSTSACCGAVRWCVRLRVSPSRVKDHLSSGNRDKRSESWALRSSGTAGVPLRLK